MTKRGVVTGFAALLAALGTFAQSAEMKSGILTSTDYHIKWYYEDGPLTLDHFQARRDVEDVKVKSELYWNIEKNLYRVKTGNTVFWGYDTKAKVDSKLSWYTRGMNEEWMLRYNQMMFDMVEYNRRLLQRDLDAGQNNPSVIFDYYTSELISTEDNIMFETNMGLDTVEVAKLESKYKALLDETPAVSEPMIPTLEKCNWGWGFYWLTGFERYSGDATDVVDYNFSPLGLRWEAAYKKLVLGFDLTLSAGRKPNPTLGVDRVIYDPEYDWYWNNTNRIMHMTADFNAGFNAYDTDRFEIIPNVGIGYGCLGQATDVYNSDGSTRTSYVEGLRLKAGVSSMYKLRRWFNSTEYMNDYSELNLLFGLSYVRSYFDQLGASNTFQITLGIGGIAWNLKSRN